jgi:hypothetical protein
VIDLEVLYSYYGKQHKVNGKNLGHLINHDLIKSAKFNLSFFSQDSIYLCILNLVK